MDDQKGKDNLIQGIKDDARNEAEKILNEVDKFILQRKKTVESQIEQIEKEAGEKANEQIESIRKSIKSAIAVEKKRLSLRIMDRIVNSTIEKAKKKITELMVLPDYPDILEGWIVEAGIGLNADEAYVNASREEIKNITDAHLKKAAETLSTLTGKKVRFKKSPDDPLLGQGIVVTAMDGKTAFNNQVHTRLLRYQSGIRKMIHSLLFLESSDRQPEDD